MTKDEALKMALEALETPWNAPYVDGCDLALGKKVKAITAIKEALAQPEPWEKFCDSNCVWTDHHPDCKLAQQEPVATKNNNGVTLHLGWDDLPVGTKLYATPPQRTWVDLTNKEVDTIRANALTKEWAILMAQSTLKEKNNG